MFQSRTSYLCHVDDPYCQGFVAQDGSVLVPLPPLQHHVQTVHVVLQEVRILKDGGGAEEKQTEICNQASCLIHKTGR